VTLGSLEDLQRATKGGMDPNGLGASRLASDVLWSDPVGERGFQPNVARGVGMCFGPDVTEVCWGGGAALPVVAAAVVVVAVAVLGNSYG